MIAIDILYTNQIINDLGWTLIHFIWQGLLVALLFLSARILLRQSASRVRYGAACATMLLMAVLPAATFYSLRTSSLNRETGKKIGSSTARVTGQTEESDGLPKDETVFLSKRSLGSQSPEQSASIGQWARERFSLLLPWMVFAWLAGIFALSFRFLGGWYKAQKLREWQTAPVVEELQKRAADLSRRLRLSRPVRICESAIVEVPTVIGWLRPIILIPTSALTGLSTQQLEALLAHELAHIRRHDYLINLIQTVVETLLFYHPAVWWVSNQVRLEREHCCDDIAVAECGNLLIYARALTELEQMRASAARLVVAASGGSLLGRIRRLVEVPSRRSHRSLRPAPIIAVLAAFSLLPIAWATILTNNSSMANSNELRIFSPYGGRSVAVTFVGLPSLRSQSDDLKKVTEITEGLLKEIISHKIPAVGFVGEGKLHKDGELEERVALLRMWLDAGVELGNETFSHKYFYKRPIAEFQEDTIRGEAITKKLLKERGVKLRYFSYPFLNTGPNLETKQAFERFLKERGYTVAPVTIDNMDWLFSKVYSEAKERGDTKTMQRVVDEYIPYMESMFEFYEKLSVDVVGYEIPQILMLCATELNADHFDELIGMIKKRGYRFISLDWALEDRAYNLPDNYTGPVGISWLQRWAVTKGMGVRKEPYLSDFMKQFDNVRSSASDFKTENK